MATKAQIMGGLEILAKYVDDDYQWFIRPGHDQIWAGYDDGSITEEDREKLHALGWFADEGSWSRFV